MRVTNIAYNPNITSIRQPHKTKFQANVSFKAFHGKIDNSRMAKLKPEVQEAARNLGENLKQIREIFGIMKEKNFCAKKTKRIKTCYEKFIPTNGRGYLFQLGECTALLNTPEKRKENVIIARTTDNKTGEKQLFFIEDNEKIITNSAGGLGSLPVVKKYMTQEEIAENHIEEKILLMSRVTQNYVNSLNSAMGSENNGIPDAGCLSPEMTEKLNITLENITNSGEIIKEASKIACARKILDIKRQYPNYVPIGGLEGGDSGCYKYGDKILLVRKSDKFDDVVRIILKPKKEGEEVEEVICVENGEKIIRKSSTTRYYIPEKKDRVYLTQKEIEESNAIDYINYLEKETTAFLKFLQEADFSPKPRGGYRPRKPKSDMEKISSKPQEKVVPQKSEEVQKPIEQLAREKVSFEPQEKVMPQKSEEVQKPIEQPAREKVIVGDFDISSLLDMYFDKTKQSLTEEVKDTAKFDAKEFAAKVFVDFVNDLKEKLQKFKS